MSLRDMRSVVWLAKDQQIAPTSIEDAARRYRMGVTENPWKKPHLQRQIRLARRSILKDERAGLRARVLGQDEAIGKVLDVLIRSTMGLTAAHSSRHTAGPRGVLFFAGPTGVGKTELAKSVAEFVFGREEAYIRFDMSEFSAEHSEARLIGAPPGYIGHDTGGELTNAVRERPFSLVLFDEIEKAHDLVLDKFLQILEDGRLSDGRGGTTYFSETLLVFTSNLGLYVPDESGSKRLRLNVKPTDKRSDLENNVRDAIREHFTTTMGRPELLNRIGIDNIIVFNFITPNVAADLVGLFMRNVKSRVEREHRVTLVIEPACHEAIEAEIVSDDEVLAFGGRGIASRLSAIFIEPLGRALFDFDLQFGGTVNVVGAGLAGDGRWEVLLR
jgi:ATP-dependent Clp protease ATP-binding subunit ClpA